MSSSIDIWRYREGAAFEGREATSVAGYGVEALDGSIGHVDEASDAVSGGFIVVDTGPWIFGKKVLLPAGTVERIDHDREKVFVARTKEQIKAAPELEESESHDRHERHRDVIGGYYGPGGQGWYEVRGGEEPPGWSEDVRDWGSTPTHRTS